MQRQTKANESECEDKRKQAKVNANLFGFEFVHLASCLFLLHERTNDTLVDGTTESAEQILDTVHSRIVVIRARRETVLTEQRCILVLIVHLTTKHAENELVRAAVRVKKINNRLSEVVCFTAGARVHKRGLDLFQEHHVLETIPFVAVGHTQQLRAQVRDKERDFAAKLKGAYRNVERAESNLVPLWRLQTNQSLLASKQNDGHNDGDDEQDRSSACNTTDQASVDFVCCNVALGSFP